MALGKNLKKKQLIPDKAEKEAEKKPAKKKGLAKKAASTKKAGSPEKKTTSRRAKAKTTTQKTVSAPKKSVKPDKKVKNTPPPQVVQEEELTVSVPVGNEPSLNLDLPVYIAQELIERKRALRAKYNEDIKKLRGQSIQFIVLKMGGELYAVDIDVVKEVVPLKDISKTPNTPEHIKGIVNVRGNTYVVFDLATKFKIVGDEVARFLLIINSKEITASLMLSSLPATFKVNGDDISTAMQTMEDVLLDASYVKGLIHDKERLIYYLDIVELLKNDKAMIVPDKFLENLNE